MLRGIELIQNTVRPLALYKALALPVSKQWAHVPLLLAQDKRRLAKRDGDLSLKALRERGVKPEMVVSLCAASAGLLGRAEDISARELIAGFNVTQLAREDFAFSANALAAL